MPYLEITKDNESEDSIINKVVVPNLEGLTVSEASQILKECNLSIECSERLQSDENTIINEQVPVSGVEVFEGSSVIVK